MHAETQKALHHSIVSDHLLADHRRFDKLLELFEVALAADERHWAQSLWTQIEERLSAHLDVEDRLLIPTFARFDALEARRILDEHVHIRAGIVELGTALDLHMMRIERVRAFAYELDAHARREDKLLYRWVDDHLSGPDRITLFRELENIIRAESQAERHP